MTKRKNDGAETIQSIMGRETEKNPHNRGIINAFRPVMIARANLLEKMSLHRIDLSDIDDTRFQGGVPLIRQQRLLLPDDPWDEVSSGLIPAMQEGFPGIRDDMERLKGSNDQLKELIGEYLDAFPDHNDAVIERRAGELSVAPQAVSLLMGHMIRIILEKRSQAVAERIKNLEWKKGYCPICGAFPTLALIEEKITRRWLHCARCGHDWLFSRAICPFCENEAQQGMDFFYVENKPQETAFTCGECRRYLVTLNRVSDLHDHDLDVSALALAHLDIIMQQKGFLPMAPCEWNSF